VSFGVKRIWSGLNVMPILRLYKPHRSTKLMARLDIDFILIDESVVQYGFRVLMAGLDLEGFKKNPVMLFMHSRAESGCLSGALDKDAVLPIGKWYDIRKDGDKLLAKPEFDDDDDFAQRIEKKVKKGYLNAASISLEPIAVSDEEDLKLAGQRGPTVTKSSIGEASIVDMPNCKNALAIRNSAGRNITLSASEESTEALSYLTSLIQTDNMDRKLLATKLGLPENASDADISAKLTAVMGEAAKITDINAEVVKLKGDKQELETKLSGLENEAKEAKVNNLVDGAIAAKKLTAADRDKYVKLAKADYETTKELIESMKGFDGLQNTLSGSSSDTNNVELQELVKLTGRELYMQGKFERLQQLSAAHYKVKYKEYFGSEPTA
jgi:hypothetical protein